MKKSFKEKYKEIYKKAGISKYRFGARRTANKLQNAFLWNIQQIKYQCPESNSNKNYFL